MDLNLDMKLILSLILKVFKKICLGSPCYLVVVSGGPFSWWAQIRIQYKEGVIFGVCRFPVVRPFCSTLSFGRPLELQVFQLGIGRMSGLHLRMGDPLP